MLSAMLNDNTAVCICGIEASLDLVFKQQWALHPNWNLWGRDGLWTASHQLQTSSQTTAKANRSSTSILMPAQQHGALSLLKETCWKSRLQESCQEHSHTQWTESQSFVTKPTPDSHVKLCLTPKTKIWKLLLAGSSISCINRNETKI